MIVLPWSAFWERNYFVHAWPALGPIVTDYFVRGGISGLGFLNLLAGLSELAPVFGTGRRHNPAEAER